MGKMDFPTLRVEGEIFNYYNNQLSFNDTFDSQLTQGGKQKES